MESRRSDDAIHRVTFNEPHLHGVIILRNFFSHDECQQIIDESEDWGESVAQVYKEPGKTNPKSHISEDLRKGHIRHYDYNTKGPTWFHDILKQAAVRYTESFPDGPAYDLENPKLSVEVACYTDRGDHFETHQDMYIRSEHLSDKHKASQTRKLSMSCILSEEFHGGRLSMVGSHGVSNPMPLFKGDICLFPSYQLHKVSRLEGGERYSLICWVLGDFWR